MTDTTPPTTPPDDSRLHRLEDRARFCRAGCEASEATGELVAEIRRLRSELGKANAAITAAVHRLQREIPPLRAERDVWHGRALGLQDERDLLAADLQRASDAANSAVDRAQRAEDDRDQLRRQLDAAEAAPCGHDGTAFDALERLHGRIKRDLPGDGSDVQEPAEPHWARTLDELLAFADELYMPLADATRKPGDAEPEKYPPHTVTVTRLPAGFDHNDRREHEYVIGNDTTGWTSHQVTHPQACHRLPYGRSCWLDESWYQGPYRYDEIEPGRYEATWVSEMVGDHRGEFSHMDEYVHYERTSDAETSDESTTTQEGQQ